MVGRNRSDTDIQIAILKEAIVAAKKKFAGEKAATEHITVDTPVPYVLSELIQEVSAAAGDLGITEQDEPVLAELAKTVVGLELHRDTVGD